MFPGLGKEKAKKMKDTVEDTVAVASINVSPTGRLGLFPVPVFIYKLGRDLTEEEMAFVMACKENLAPNSGNTTSAERYVLNTPVMKDVRYFIEGCMNSYFLEVYSPPEDTKLRITQSWLNYSDKGQFHHLHAHPNSLISGVFYPSTTENDKIYFHSPITWKQLSITPMSFNPYNSQTWWIPAEKNSLVLFPSSLQHNVNTVESETTRISLSFNTFPTGHIGDEPNLTGVYLGQ